LIDIILGLHGGGVEQGAATKDNGQSDELITPLVAKGRLH